MIVISGEFELNPGTVEEVRAAAIDMMAETAKEAGCIHYRFYQDIERPETFHVYEEWETSEHLKAHANSAHMAVWREALGKIGLKSRNVKMMEVSETKAL